MNTNSVDDRGMDQCKDLYPQKYRKLIDDQTWAFIEQTNSWYPPDTVDYPIDKQRDIYDRMCRSFFDGYPDGIEVETGFIPATDNTPDLPVRTYLPERKTLSEDKAVDAIVLYFHGGGFVVGGLDSHDDVCAEICKRTGYGVLCVDYRLAPEHTFPADFHDALAAFDYATGFGPPVVLAGDSAGGNLAAAVCHARRCHSRQPVGQVLIYPSLGNDMSKGSFPEHANAPMLTLKDMEFYKTLRTGGDKTLLNDKRCAPLQDDDFSGIVPSVLVTAQCDPLADNGRDYRDRVLAAGGKAVWINEPGLVHGYLRARRTVDRAARSFDRIIDAISQLGQQKWPGEQEQSA